MTDSMRDRLRDELTGWRHYYGCKLSRREAEELADAVLKVLADPPAGPWSGVLGNNNGKEKEMSERIDHATRALQLSQSEYSDPRTDTAVAIQTEALVHATLALVEQQRIANKQMGELIRRVGAGHGRRRR